MATCNSPITLAEIVLSPGLSEASVRKISALKEEPAWLLEKRIQAHKKYEEMSMPGWAPDISALDHSQIIPFRKSGQPISHKWENLATEVGEDLADLRLQENHSLSGIETQWESEAVYQSLKDEWHRQGVIFTDTDTARREYPRLFRQYFGKLVPQETNKYTALNTAFWSGGTFLYVPKGVRVEQPLQTYFRVNARRMGQFERTIIIAEEDSYVHYLEGCSNPYHTDDVLHAAVVEVYAAPRAHIRYTTMQNWSENVYNLVTKRAIAQEEALIEWVDCNFGSKITMKYPGIRLAGRGARAEILSLSLAKSGQNQDSGANIIFAAPDTSAVVKSKSVAANGGISTFRGNMIALPEAENAKGHLVCDNLVKGENSQANSFPNLKIRCQNPQITHEASISRINKDQLFYLQSRGLSEGASINLLINGFLDPILKNLPLEYQLEVSRLTQV